MFGSREIAGQPLLHLAKLIALALPPGVFHCLLPRPFKLIANALLLAVAFLLAIAFYLMGELKFLVPYRAFLFREYGWALAVFFGVLFLNLFAGAFVVIRKFLLKDTGRKLSHIDKQFHVGNVHLPADSDYDERT